MIEYDKIFLRPGDEKSFLLCPAERPSSARPALIVVPGGGYRDVCITTEGYPLAERFSSLGFSCFILNYRVAPHTYPAPQQDLARAIRLVRHNAAKWGVMPDNVAVCGFSAGGHLCASLGTIFDDVPPETLDDADGESCRPDALILCYPVITSGEYAHTGSFQRLLGADYEAKKDFFSLEKRVTEKSSPAFIWTTFGDVSVPYQNGVLFAQALAEKLVPSAVHVFTGGYHGMAMGHGRKDVSLWQDMAVAFLRSQVSFRLPVQRVHQVGLVFDDCADVRSHVEPVLKEYGFSASFTEQGAWKDFCREPEIAVCTVSTDAPWGFAQVCERAARRKLVMVYQSLSGKFCDKDSEIFENFRKQIKFLYDNGYEAVSFEKFSDDKQIK